MRILIIAPYFPPCAGVCTARMASLATQMSESGHDVYVLSDDPSSYDVFDDEYDIKSVSRISVSDHSGFFCSAKKYYNKVRQLLSTIEPLDNIIITVGPFYNIYYMHKIAKLVRRYSTSIVLDMRDFWLSKNDLRGKFYDKYIKRYLLKRAFKHVAKIVVVCQGMALSLSQNYGLDPVKLTVIRNGFSEYNDEVCIPPIILGELEKLNHSTDLTLAISGSFSNYSKTNAEISLSSILHPSMRIGFVHIGNSDAMITDYISNNLTNSNEILTTGFQNYDVTMKLLSLADALLIVGRHKIGLGTKVYDYIHLNKPIILVNSTASELSDFLSKFKNFYLCKSTKELYATLNLIKENGITVLDDTFDISSYSRTTQNNKYISLLQNL